MNLKNHGYPTKNRLAPIIGLDLYPEDQFQLYGISSRYPKKLFSQQPELTKVQDGVYDMHRGSDNIRLIVLNEIPHAKHNAIWHLFSGTPGEVEFAARQYRGKTQEISTVLNTLFDNYNLEGFPVSYTMKDFQKDYVKNHLGLLSPDEVLQQFSPHDRLKGLSPDEVLQQFSPDEVLNSFSPDDRLKGLLPDEVLRRFSPEEIELYLENLGKNRGK